MINEITKVSSLLNTVNTDINQTNKDKINYFCNLPVEISEYLFSYMDLKSILNTSETCTILNNRIANWKPLKKLRDQYELIKQQDIIPYLTINPNVIASSRKILLNNIDLLSENTTNKNQAILSIKASNSYGSQFAIANLMSEGMYEFQEPYEVDFKLSHETTDTELFITDCPDKYLIRSGKLVYFFDASTKQEVAINSSFFLQSSTIDAEYQIIIKNNFIIINSNNGRAIILKKGKNSYYDVTPKDLEYSHDANYKICNVYTDSSNSVNFLILKNNESYIYTEKKEEISKSSNISIFYNIISYLNYTTSLTTDSANINGSATKKQKLTHDYNNTNYNVTNITPKNLRVLDVKTSENNNLTLFYGVNKITNINELHVQINGKIKSVLTPPEIVLYSIKDDGYQIFCSPKGNSFVTHEISECNKEFHSIKFYLIDDDGIIEDNVHSLSKDDKNIKKSYLADHCLEINKGITEERIFFTRLKRGGDFTHWNLFSNTKFSISNQNKILYASYFSENEREIINLFDFYYKGRESLGSIPCKQKVQDAKFSPNSQLLMTKERFSQDQDNDDFNTIRIYRIICKDKNSQLSISDSNNDMIAEVNMHKQIQNFEFHPSGLKIIVVVDNSIKIINLIKDTTTSF